MEEHDKLKLLKRALELQDKLQSEKKIRKDKFDNENQVLTQQIKENYDDIMLIKSDLTQLNLIGYEEDGNKSRFGGVGIKVMKMLDFKEEDAFQWAKDHQLCLQLDLTSFKKIAKTQDFGFVTVTEVPTVTFPKEIKLEGE